MPGVLTMGGRGPGAVDKLDLAKARVGSGRGVACRNLLSHAQAISEVNGGIEQLGATKFQFYTCVPYTEKKSPYSTFSHISTLALHRLPLYGLLDHTFAPLWHCLPHHSHKPLPFFLLSLRLIPSQICTAPASPRPTSAPLHGVGTPQRGHTVHPGPSTRARILLLLGAASPGRRKHHGQRSAQRRFNSSGSGVVLHWAACVTFILVDLDDPIHPLHKPAVPIS
ncbi:unnamed protein product, partial [Closterium sp. NIES-64]